MRVGTQGSCISTLGKGQLACRVRDAKTAQHQYHTGYERYSWAPKHAAYVRRCRRSTPHNLPCSPHLVVNVLEQFPDGRFPDLLSCVKRLHHLPSKGSHNEPHNHPLGLPSAGAAIQFKQARLVRREMTVDAPPAWRSCAAPSLGRRPTSRRPSASAGSGPPGRVLATGASPPPCGTATSRRTWSGARCGMTSPARRARRRVTQHRKLNLFGTLYWHRKGT